MSVQTLLQAADTAADRLGLLQRPLRIDDLIETAHAETGLSDFGEFPVRDALRHFLEPCLTEASLGLFGRMATRWDVLRFLRNLLILRDLEHRSPALTQEPIEQPVIITGLPRSGTSFLHQLLMLDPVNRAPLVWQTIYPYPLGPARRDTRPDRVARQLRAFEWLAPEFRNLHPIRAQSPQECTEITAHVFRSLRFDTTYRIPSYRAWLDSHACHHVTAYRFHKRFLQHLQHQEPARPETVRWVLKCPDHLFALHAVRSVYPNARLVFVHRDPVKVLLSVAKLTEVLRRPFTRLIDRREIGREESARWLEGTQRMIDAAADAGLHEPICHIHYLDLVADPVGTVQDLYRQFGMELAESVARAIRKRVAAQPNGGYGPRNYRFEDHGLNAEAEREKFRPYMLHFGVQAEAIPGLG